LLIEVTLHFDAPKRYVVQTKCDCEYAFLIGSKPEMRGLLDRIY